MMFRYVIFLILCVITQICLSHADTCGSCVCPSHVDTPSVAQQGRPGKVGPKGEKGDSGIQGDIGPMGQQGECACGVSLEDFQEVTQKLAELADEKIMANQKLAALTTELADEKIMANQKLAALTTELAEFKGLFNECASSPCQNGATCNENGVDRFTCTCAVEYTGADCSLQNGPFWECSSSPCMNGATCNENGGGRYTCTCADGYLGDDCSVPCGLSFNGVCYNLHTTSIPFESARAKCSSLGQRLAEVKTLQTLEAVKEYIRGIKGRSTYGTWIAGSYRPVSGNSRVTWEDSSSTVIPSDIWYPGSPDTSSSYSSYTRLVIYVRDTQSTSEGIFNYPPTSSYPALCQST